MKTLIELYDERPLENVLCTEVFGAEETVFICPSEVAKNKSLRESLEEYFKRRGCHVKLTFVPVSLLNEQSVEKSIRQILDSREDCVINISGGTDAALFAAGAVSGETPVITYSHRKNTFFEIRNAPFARNLKCDVRLDVASCFFMAGGRLQKGREDNERLPERLDDIAQLFEIFTKYRKIWNRQISYLQKISSAGDEELMASGPKTVKADHGHVTVHEEFLEALEIAGFICQLRMEDDLVSFRFADDMTRFWLRDIGSALELQVYRACKLAGCFDDVVLSAVVNWGGNEKKQVMVSNEIDVVAVRGIHPVFISCKSGEVKTEALNELAILRDRFGGKASRAILVTSTSTKDRLPMLMRAEELSIEVIEWDGVETGKLIRRLSRKFESSNSAMLT